MSIRIVITGGAGFLGRALAARLLARGEAAGPDGRMAEIREILLVDVAPAGPLGDPRLKALQVPDLDAASVAAALAGGADGVFHLAAVVSGAAEADFDLGLRVNVDGTRSLLQGCRALARPPRLVFTSSVAVFGGSLPDVVTDGTAATPTNSYGAQKAIGELLVADHARKGMIDGRAVRLPTVVVRPGKPNRAASSFASGIIREPLAGMPADCPVTPETLLWILSPRQAVASLMRAHDLDAAGWGSRHAVNLPGLSVTVAEMLAALRRVAGDAVADRVRPAPDPTIQGIVGGWPGRFEPLRASRLGFEADPDMDAVIRAHIEDGRPA